MAPAIESLKADRLTWALGASHWRFKYFGRVEGGIGDAAVWGQPRGFDAR